MCIRRAANNLNFLLSCKKYYLAWTLRIIYVEKETKNRFFDQGAKLRQIRSIRPAANEVEWYILNFCKKLT